MLQLCGLFYPIRKYLTSQQIILAYKAYNQRFLPNGIFAFANTDISSIIPLEIKIERFIKTIKYKRKHESVPEIRAKNQIFSQTDLANKILKLLIKILRIETEIDNFGDYFKVDEIKQFQKKRNMAKNLLCHHKNCHHKKSLHVTVRIVRHGHLNFFK